VVRPLPPPFPVKPNICWVAFFLDDSRRIIGDAGHEHRLKKVLVVSLIEKPPLDDVLLDPRSEGSLKARQYIDHSTLRLLDDADMHRQLGNCGPWFWIGLLHYFLKVLHLFQFNLPGRKINWCELVLFVPEAEVL
jgi:hypothetical protein